MSNTVFNRPMRAVLGAALKWTLLGTGLTLVTSGCGAPMEEPNAPVVPGVEQEERQGDEDAPRQALAPQNEDWSAPLSEDPHAYDAELASNTPEGLKTALAVPSCVASDLSLTWWPLSGANGRVWMVNNYVDLDPAASLLEDYLGFTGSLARTYDGHRGIDIDISSFREMDSGSALVRAAAPGIVTFVEEGQFDRNTSCTGNWNVVRIQHANGYDTLYGHLKRNSVVVNVGDTVTAGQVLGVAGSSGCSTQPHLHFELQDCSNTAVESFSLGMWASPPAYHAPSDVMDVMLRKGAISTQQIKDPAPNPTLYAPGETLGIGLSMSGRGGDVVDLSLTAPDGVVDAWTWNVPGAARYRHMYPAWPKVVGSTPGTWTLRVRINGSLRATRTYNVSTLQPGYSEVARHGVPASSYQTVFNDITAAGYRPVWVDGYEDGSNTYYNAVFRPADGYAWAARHALTSAQYQTEVDTLVDQGYRLMQVDSYLTNGAVRYAAIFTKKPGPDWVAYHGRTEAEHQSLFNTYASSGYRLVNASVVSVSGQRYFTALYDKANVGGWVALQAIAASQYQAEFDTQRAAGRYLQYLNTYVHGGTVYYSAVWDSVPYGAWAARHALSSSQYQTEFDTWTGAGYLTRLVTGYSVNGAHRFAGLWTH
ncbi:peptidoglycan DD-metalloendopeptidase family protein [Myxococcus sp. RHSTA-1-4]|uniref:peptidoglycan DD-metalloendopeptidase family protein n=1 Tax=Myxococcus sp. RHSTA-1-4 TaxID=2874601 RepID=UPI001CBF81A7|nr:peptidoglycan DD-metalloendopeptidase family protein [Myxococcus sp. RHSTA-1-4]MBZ4420658.1 peptidoglycan DD-metalloendopeptidase family protein [Myxococcus sp. RHSTA-1-4]